MVANPLAGFWKKWRLRIFAVAAIVILLWVYFARDSTKTTRTYLPEKYPSANREFLLHAKGGVHSLRPLVLVLADEGMTATQIEKSSGVSSYGDDHGFVVAYLDAVGGQWNPAPTSPDPQYLVDTARYVATKTPVDLRRVYVWGLAEGGAEALRTACDARPGVFAAVATVGPVGVVPARCATAKNVLTQPGPSWGSSTKTFWKFSAPIVKK